MLTNSTPRFLRARRGASLAEYAVLSGVLGAAVIGSVLALGGEAVQGTEAGTAALQDAFYVAETPDPAPVAPPSGGGVEGEGAEAPPAPPPPPAPAPVWPAECFAGLETVWQWSPNGETTTPATTAASVLRDVQTGPIQMRGDCGHWPIEHWASYVSFGTFGGVSGAAPHTTHAPAPFGDTSGYRFMGNGQGVDVSFYQPVIGLEFYIHDLDGLLPTPALYDSRGRLIRPASPGYRDRVFIEGIAPDGSIVYPVAAGGVGVSNGGGSFSGLSNRNCDTWHTDCTARFLFNDTVVSLRITKDGGGVFDVSDLLGLVQKP